MSLEEKLISLECTANYANNSEYVTCKSTLDELNKEKANSIRIRGKFDGNEIFFP